MSEEIKPVLTTIDVQRGWKDVTIVFKSDERRTIRVKAPGWQDVAALHLESGNDQGAVETGLHSLALPAHLGGECEDAGPALAWLDWLDIESRNELSRIVREFAYGFTTEKKRTLAIREISKLLSRARATPPSNVSASGLPTPSPGADPSSDSSLAGFAELKPTTASDKPSP